MAFYENSAMKWEPLGDTGRLCLEINLNEQVDNGGLCRRTKVKKSVLHSAK